MKKTDIDELIETADRLCDSLEKAANEEKRYHNELGFYLNLYRKQVERGSYEIAQIRERFGDL